MPPSALLHRHWLTGAYLLSLSLSPSLALTPPRSPRTARSRPLTSPATASPPSSSLSKRYSSTTSVPACSLLSLSYLFLFLTPLFHFSLSLSLSLSDADHGFFGSRGYFDLFQKYSSFSPEFSKTIEEVFCETPNVTTDIGRGRAFISYALNNRDLSSYMSLLLSHAEVLEEFYDQKALMRNAESASTLICSSLLGLFHFCHIFFGFAPSPLSSFFSLFLLNCPLFDIPEIW